MTTFQEAFKDCVQEFIRKKQLQHYYAQKETRRNLLHVVNMEQNAAKPHHAIVTTETDGYLVSVLKQPTQNKDSYVTWCHCQTTNSIRPLQGETIEAREVRT